ncbi:putative hydrolase [Anatilimnocola aggregata]|uniref:Putative hydrolase n=1 Tax=Anatilimnocola aggregata TaxID=2528021 RepID=A0A517Y6B7_9BACT|nr:phospholipase [Anatilimnocola aggregata]QDU25672.1 putative hydrolase [Anatilimnocola aggregata]
MIAVEANYGGLDCIVVRSPNQPPRLAVILCHGFGASGEDLAGLAEPILERCGDRHEEIAIVFPAAPLSLEEQGMPGGRAWWWIDLERLLNLPTPETLQRFRRDRPAGMTEATNKVSQLVAELRSEWKLTAAQIVVGGFSQGSMVATDTALSLVEAPAALIIYSGSLVSETDWVPRMPQLVGTKVLQSHGRRDPILPLFQAEALRDKLMGAGCSVKYLEFAGFHEIHPAAIQATADLLQGLL